MLDVQFKKDMDHNAESVAIMIDNKLRLDKNLINLDTVYSNVISNFLKNNEYYTGEFGQTKIINTINNEGELVNIILVGVGDDNKLKECNIEHIGGIIHKIACSIFSKTVTIYAQNLRNFTQKDVAINLGMGGILASYRFEKYFTQKTDKEKFVTSSFDICLDDHEEAKELFEKSQSVAMGVFFARNLVSEVPNKLYPQTYAEIIEETFEELPIDVEILGEREMRNLGMNCLLGVGQGSINESKVAIMRYYGASDENDDPVCLVGKGVTFDTGGISLKPSLNMHDMKYDMGGSASVVGAIKALALRKAKVNAVGIVGLVENMPGGNAQRPGDVVKSMSGQTVEILNTDAEGRLVLADVIWYVQEHHKPACIIDVATLTGAVVVSLGNSYAGCFANNDDIAQNIIESGKKVDEKLWRLPLDKELDQLLKSTVADVANIGGARGMAGSSTAAHFINRFVKPENKDKWIHLDIAGVAWSSKGKHTSYPGATGFGVRLIDQFVKDNYEEKDNS